MAFENNQQDAFNLRNDTESLKRLETELDKATTAIGAAEVSAEEELAALKIKNLAVQHEARIKKLNELIEREEAGIRELAALRLQLSDKQFEARKKEIQKELQLAEKALEDLHKAEDKKAKKSEDSNKKQTSNTDDITYASKAKSAVAGEKTSVKESRKTTDPDIVKLVGSIDKTLSSLRDTVASRGTQKSPLKEKDLLPSQQVTTATTKETPAAKAAGAGVVISKVNDIPQPNQEVIEKSLIKDAESEAQPKLVNLVSSIDKTLASLLDTVSKHNYAKEEDSLVDTTEALKKAIQQSQADDGASSNGATTVGGVNGNNNGGNVKSEVSQTDSSEARNYTNDSGKMKAVNLGVTSLTDLIEGLEVNHTYLKSLKRQEKQNGEKSTLDTLNGIIKNATRDQSKAEEAVANGKKAPSAKISQTTLDLSGNLLKNIEAASEAEKELLEFKKDLTLNTQLTILAEEQKLLKAHYNAEQRHLDEMAAKEAIANDLKNNKQSYYNEQIWAREEALAEKRNQLELGYIKAEADSAFNTAHSEELMAQALHEKQLSYAQEYQTLQLEAGAYAISLEKYKADQERKRHTAAKKEAVSGIVDGLKKFGTGEFSVADVKQSYGKYMGQRTAELKESGMDDASAKLTANFELLAEAAGGLAATLDAKVKEISSMQGIVDTRLQGSSANDRDFGNGSYWNELLEDAKKIAGASPFIKQEKLVDNIKVLVEKGISFDIKQRAFLMTIQEKIANTFDVADGTLLRLVRIQQQDTTAGRLGMESALNSFLNSMYETSEYLSEVADGVRSSLEEMQALMDGAAATEVEFQVQKWMGSLYSVGMSKSAVDSIAQTFGQIASGDIGGLTGGGAGNLLIMAANEAGMSIADILQDGLNADETNKLMQAMVNYLAEIAETSSDSRVVQQQLANVYGVKASDLRAATNLASSVNDISSKHKFSNLTYDGMLGQLESMMNTIRFRTSIGEGMTNMWDNMMYSMASTQASNPILYALPKMADLLRDVTGGGGIALPGISVMGNMVDLHTSVADLMSVASMAGTALGSLGPLLTGIADLANPLVGSAMLSRAGINTKGKAPVIARGSAQPLQHISGSSISESGHIGNASGDDVKNATLQDAADEKKKQMIQAKDEESADDVASRANQAVVDIYNLLEEVAHGSQSLRVRVVNNNTAGGSGGTVIGNTSGAGTTGVISGDSGMDNGNWVLSF